MNNAKFGDSHDYVKRGLLLTIAEPDKWIVHPMPFYFDGGGGRLDLDDYATFLGLPHTSVMGHRNKENRRAHLLSPGNLLQDVARFSHHYLFLDPDTGVNDKEVGGTKHITVSQLTKIAEQRADKIILVFDQSFNRGGEAKDKLEEKLKLFEIGSRFCIVRASPYMTTLALASSGFPLIRMKFARSQREFEVVCLDAQIGLQRNHDPRTRLLEQGYAPLTLGKQPGKTLIR